MYILGIESSCDETAVAVVEDGRKIISNVINSQAAEHGLYGGVVPEIASRRHIEAISRVTQAALKEADLGPMDIDAVACTYAPGLIGALLVGVSFAKGFAYSAQKPLVPVHHLRGHIAALYLTWPRLRPPFLCLVASGGHSHIVAVEDYTKFTVLGRTVDDAAGEAFDKVSRVLGLGYPGGPAIAKAAKEGDKAKYSMPTPHTRGKYDVSFSGLKTAVINLVNTASMKGDAIDVPSLAASFQEKVADILSSNLVNAAGEYGFCKIALRGGVCANERLRELVAEKRGDRLVYAPDIRLCGDNGAMIASRAYYEYMDGKRGGLDLNGIASLDISAG